MDPTGILSDSVGRQVQHVEAILGRQMGYLIYYNRNLENLQTHVDKLGSAKNTMLEKITEAKAKGEQIHSDVEHWLTKVAETTKEAEEILKGKRQSTTEEANKPLKDEGQSTESSQDQRQPTVKCVPLCFPIANPLHLRHRSKKSVALVQVIIELINDERQISDISYVYAPPRNLQTEVEKLMVAKDTVVEKVIAAEAKGEIIHANVQDWLNKVDGITKEAQEFLKDEIQATEEPHDFMSHQSMKSLELLQVVAELINEERQLSDISYIYTPPKNLQTEVDKLTVAKATVDEKVTAAEAKGEEIHADVQGWLKKVDAITKEAEEFLTDEIQETEEPHNSMSLRSKKSLALLQVVTELYEMREFSDISYFVLAKDICLESGQGYQEFDSRASTLEKMMDELRNPNSADIILVHGIGGVGKTTLAEEVLRQAEKEKLFDHLIMVRDVKKPNLEAIQKVIADKLGLKDSDIQSKEGRADKICARIKGQKGPYKQDKKTLVIIDDVWEEIDFKAVGLPHISTCRILLTSKISKLFSADKVNQKPFPLGVLGEEETWLLFEKTAGNIVEDLSIQPIATQVAKKCGDLPVLVVTVASSLRNETSLSIWRDALRSLEKFDKKEELTEKAYLGLEWSYTQLNKHLKPLFLLCGTIVEGNSISLTTLLKYSMGLGFFRTVKEARDALDTQVGKLKASSLLLDGDDDTCVRMHDLVHSVVNKIAYEDNYVLIQDGADDELQEWAEEDLSRFSKISLTCCNIATLPEVPWECPELEMFHLHCVVNKIASRDHPLSRDIPSNFFEGMKKLKVLGFKNLPSISLPPSLQFLKNLQTLCLDGCMFEDIAQVGELRKLQILSIVKSKVKQLPKEIGQLTSLRLLDLSDCSLLQVISPGVISNLTRLEDLRMRNSFDKWEGEGVICETSNASLLELQNLSKLTALEIRIPDANILPPNLFSNKLERYQIVVGEVIGDPKENPFEMSATTLNTLKLKLTTNNELDQNLKMLEKCDVLSIDGMDGFDFAYIINTKELISNVRTLSVNKCDGLTFLLSSSVAKYLKKLEHLEILHCEIIEQIVSAREQDEEDNVFSELKSLTLKDLPNLTRFYTGKCFKFPLLERLHIEHCNQLGAFVGGPSDNTFLFDEKVRFPRLEILHFKCKGGESELQTVWHNQLASGSFCRLKEVYISNCKSLKSIFPPSMMGRLNALETLNIEACRSVEVLFDERGISTTQSKDGQNLISISIQECRSLKNTFSASMAARCLQQLQELNVAFCDKMETIVAKEEGGLELTTTHPKFVFPKVKSLTISSLSTLGSFYPGLHTSEWPLLKYLVVDKCDRVEILAAELSIFGERQHARTKQPFFLIDQEVMMSNVRTLSVNKCDGLTFLLSSSVARNMKKLEHLEVLQCEIIEQIVSAREQDEEDNEFGELKSLRLKYLPNLTRFYTGNCFKFPLLQTLHIARCNHLGAFVGGPSDSTFLFDEKGRFPRLEKLHFDHNNGESELQKIWHNQLAPSSFCRLKKVFLLNCKSLRSIFPPSMMGRLNALEILYISFCPSVEVVFDEHGETNVKEIHGISTTHSKDGQNLTSLYIENCHCLKNTFSASMAARCFQQLEKLDVRFCDEMETIVAKEQGGLELTTTHPKFVFPKANFLSVSNMSTLRSFYPGLHTSVWPLLETLTVDNCDKVEVLAAKLSIFQERHPRAPTNQPLFLIDQDPFPVLEVMEVKNCKNIEVIVASNGDDDAGKNEIAFSQLQELTLRDLPSLQSFCSGNCIAKLPLSIKQDILNCPIKLKISPDGVPLPIPCQKD